MEYKKIIFSLGLLFSFLIVNAQLYTYPEGLRTGVPHNDDFTVRVRTKGGEWKETFEYKVQVDMDKVQDASMVQFDMGEPVEIMVKKNNGMIHSVDIRPKSKGIEYKLKGNCILFTLEKPQYLSVEVNGDRLHNLHLLANPMQDEVYTQVRDGVMYFGPGTHKPADLPNNQIRIPSNTTVYLAPGSVVEAKLLIDHAENIRIIGRGIIYHSIRGIEITDSKNVYIDGITVLNPDHYSIFGGGAENVTIKNFKSFSCKGWSDGIDVMSCQRWDIENIFMRNSDDCLALYNHRWNWWGGTNHVNVRKAVLWADVAHPINIGGHGNPEAEVGEDIENLTFRDIDILEQDEDDYVYQGCMAVVCGDKNMARNILFEDIRIESIQEGMVFNVRVHFNPKYDKVPGRGIDGITFRNVTYQGIGENQSVIWGFDEDRKVKNITFDNIVINGKRIKDTKDFLINKFVENVTVK